MAQLTEDSDDDSDDQEVKSKPSLIARLKSIFGLGGSKKKRKWRKSKDEVIIAPELERGQELSTLPIIGAGAMTTSGAASKMTRLMATTTTRKLRPYEAAGLDPESAEVLREFWGAQQIQKMVRRFLAQFKRKRQWKHACAEAGKFYVKKGEEKKTRQARRKNGVLMQNTFVRTYVSDLLQTGRVYILQSFCVVKIQRLYRGYLVRRVLSFAQSFRRQRNPPVKNKRVTAEMARRVWARTEFEPVGGWPNGIKKQKILEYDMGEYADKPPAGRDFGLKTFKVVLSARNAREERVLTKDPAAWVGIPILVEPYKLWQTRERERRTSLMLLSGTTPYSEHRHVELTPKPKAKGLAYLRELGWREEYIDRELNVLSNNSMVSKRTTYNMVNPLDTHQVADIMDGMFRPEALHKRMQAPGWGVRKSSTPNHRRASRAFSTLGGLSQESSLSLPSQPELAVAATRRKAALLPSEAPQIGPKGKGADAKAETGRRDAVTPKAAPKIAGQSDLIRSRLPPQAQVKASISITSEGVPLSTSGSTTTDAASSSHNQSLTNTKSQSESQSESQSQSQNFSISQESSKLVLGLVPGGQNPVRQGWTSVNINKHSFIPPPADPEKSKELLAASVGVSLLSNNNHNNYASAPYAKVTRLVTPLRGALKPLPRTHREALNQYSLLPDQIQRATERAKTQGFEDSQWKHSAWAAIKRHAESYARGEQDLDALRLVDEDQTLTLSDSFLKMLSADPWTRQLYRPKEITPCRIDAFPVRRKKHFKVRYSWLPQPLVGSAALRVIDDERDLHRRSYDNCYDYGAASRSTAAVGGGERYKQELGSVLEIDEQPDMDQNSIASSFVTQFDASTLSSSSSPVSVARAKKKPIRVSQQPPFVA